MTVVLYGCETWFLTLRDQHKLKVSDNRVLSKTFGPSRDEVTEQWGRPHNDEFYDLSCPPNNCRVIKSRTRWAGQVASTVERRGVYRVLVGRPWGKRPLGRSRRTWEGNMSMDLQEMRLWGGACNGLIWLRIGTSCGLM